MLNQVRHDKLISFLNTNPQQKDNDTITGEQAIMMGRTAVLELYNNYNIGTNHKENYNG